jgi:hypothetical protein
MITVGTCSIMRCYCNTQVAFTSRFTVVNDINPEDHNVTSHPPPPRGTCILLFFSHGATAPSGPGPPHCRGFTVTFRHTTLGRTSLNAWSFRRRDLYLTTHNTHKRQTSVPRRDSNPQSQQPSGRRPTPHTALPLSSAVYYIFFSPIARKPPGA